MAQPLELEGLGDALFPAVPWSWQVTVGFSLIAGVVSHHAVFRPVEIDTYLWRLLFIYLTALAVITGGYIRIGGYQIAAALLQTALVATTYNVGVFTSVFVYRAFFHPLQKVPGPFWARVSRFYAMGKMIQSRKGYQDIQKLHQKYGDIVRVGPRELSINRPSAIRSLYGAHSQTSRPPWYSQTSRHPSKSSLINTRDSAAHKLRKKIWEKALGSRALDVYESRVQPKVELLLSKIEETNGIPVDVTKYFMYFSFDVMADLGFSKNFNMLESTSIHPAIKGVHDTMWFIGLLTTIPWMLYMVGSTPGLNSLSRFSIWCHEQLDEKRNVLASEKEREPQDVMSWLLKAMDNGDSAAPPSERAVQEDSRLLIIAGSDTTAGILTSAFHLLLTNPHTYERLLAEVQEQFPGGISDWTYEKAKAIPYLDWIVYESLRLRPTAAAGMPRELPPQGIMLDGEFIPGGTIASVPPYTIQRDPRYWDEPLAFLPERWDNCSTDSVPWIAFSRGTWSCPGRGLAMMECRMVLSRIFLQYDVTLPLGMGGDTFEEDTIDNVAMVAPALYLSFTPR
ncbi:cytochrome P450 [Trichoderma compactum]